MGGILVGAVGLVFCFILLHGASTFTDDLIDIMNSSDSVSLEKDTEYLGDQEGE